MRVFFAIPIDAKTSLEIANWRERHLLGQGRPVPMVNFHITLAFVGELPAPKLERLCLSVDQWLEKRRLTRGVIELDIAGYWHKHGIFWLGAKAWSEQLTQLAGKLESLAARVGGKRPKRPFQLHVTLLRHRSMGYAAPLHLPEFRIDYNEFSLYESLQRKQGVSYHSLQDWSLSPDNKNG